MEVSFVPPDLRRLDRLKTEAISLPAFEDDRPPVGALGLVDWRLCGRVSKLIVRNQLTAARGEVVMVPARPRLTFEKVLIHGLGARSDFDLALFDRTVESMLGTLTKIRVRASVIALPGRMERLVEPALAMERFLAIAAHHDEHDDVMLVEDADAQKAMEPVLEAERRRARARGAARRA